MNISIGSLAKQLPASLLGTVTSFGTQAYKQVKEEVQAYKNDWVTDLKEATRSQIIDRIALTIFAGATAVYLAAGALISIATFALFSTLFVIDPYIMAKDVSNPQIKHESSRLKRLDYSLKKTYLIGRIVMAFKQGFAQIGTSERR